MPLWFQVQKFWKILKHPRQSQNWGDRHLVCLLYMAEQPPQTKSQLCRIIPKFINNQIYQPSNSSVVQQRIVKLSLLLPLMSVDASTSQRLPCFIFWLDGTSAKIPSLHLKLNHANGFRYKVVGWIWHHKMVVTSIMVRDVVTMVWVA